MSLEMRTYVQRKVRERNEIDVAFRRATDGVADYAEDNYGGGSSSTGRGGFDGCRDGDKGGGKGRGRGTRTRKPPAKKT